MKYVAIRKEPNGKLYMDKYFFNRYNDSDLERYKYTKAIVPEEYFDNVNCADFDEHLMFNKDQYELRRKREEEFKRLPELQSRLTELSQDFVQVQCGAVFEDLEDRIKEFQTIHNEIREIQGKEPRIYQ